MRMALLQSIARPEVCAYSLLFNGWTVRTENQFLCGGGKIGKARNG